jgi:hypothetical protein
MPRSIIVSAMENDTGVGLLSEVLTIPLLIRGSDMSNTIGFPTLSESSPFFGFLPALTRGGTTFGGILPEIVRK